MAKVLVLGSTGKVGRVVVERLVAAGETVRAATRDPQKVTPALGVEPVRFDINDPVTYAPALEGTDRVFALVPPGVLSPDTAMRPFMQEATRDPRRKIVLMTALGVDVSDDDPHRRLERLVERSGAPFTFVRPNWFMDNFHTIWLPSITTQGIIAVPAAIRALHSSTCVTWGAPRRSRCARPRLTGAPSRSPGPRH